MNLHENLIGVSWHATVAHFNAEFQITSFSKTNTSTYTELLGRDLLKVPAFKNELALALEMFVYAS